MILYVLDMFQTPNGFRFRWTWVTLTVCHAALLASEAIGQMSYETWGEKNWLNAPLGGGHLGPRSTKFQVPEIEVLNLIRLYWGGVSLT